MQLLNGLNVNRVPSAIHGTRNLNIIVVVSRQLMVIAPVIEEEVHFRV